MDSASSGIFFPEGCGSVAEGNPDPNKVPVEIDSKSNNKRVEDATDNFEEDDGSLQEFEEGNDENTKVEESFDSGYDDGNVQEVPVNNESVSTTGESFSNNTPESRLASEIKVQHKLDEIS